MRQIGHRITDPNISVVSFDVFDTLLARPVLQPTDLFYLVERKVKDYLGDALFPFTEVRIWAERRAREQMKIDSPLYEDINLDEIYRKFAELAGLSSTTVRDIRRIELETELKYLKRRRSIEPLYDLAVRSGKKVVVVSDVYLPAEFLSKALRINGYKDIAKYYVSSELRISKGSGAMFNHVLADLRINASEMIHIGDNKRADFARARDLGIAAVHVPKTSDVFFTDRVDSSLWRGRLNNVEPSMRLVLGFIINRLFDNSPQQGWSKESVFNGNPYILGYYGAGPLILFMTKWLLEETTRAGIDTLAFIARDGYVPMKVFRLLQAYYDDNPETIYVRASRNALLPFDIHTRADAFMTLYKLHFNPNLTAEEVLARRYRLEVTPNVRDHFARHGIPLGEPINDRSAFLNATLSLGEGLFDGLREQRQLAQEYYRKRVSGKGKVALFDVGYSGRAQRVLSSILDEKPTGYYFFSFHEVLTFAQRGLSHQEYFSVPQNRWIKDPGFSTALMELFLSEAGTGSLLGFEREDENVVEAYDTAEFEPKSMQLIQRIQEGILDFCREFVATFGDDLRLLDISAATAGHVLSTFMTTPHNVDAQIFDGVRFGSAATGQDDMNILGETLEQSHWRQGYRARHRRGADGKPAALQGRPDISLTRAQQLTVIVYNALTKGSMSDHHRRRMKSDPVDFFSKSKHPANVAARRVLNLLGPQIPNLRR